MEEAQGDLGVLESIGRFIAFFLKCIGYLCLCLFLLLFSGCVLSLLDLFIDVEDLEHRIRQSGFFQQDFFLLLAIACFLLAGFCFRYLKPHPAEKHFLALAENKISRQEAIEKIAGTMYDWKRKKIPSVATSKWVERRLKALRGRVKVEKEFMEELIKYLKTRSRLE